VPRYTYRVSKALTKTAGRSPADWTLHHVRRYLAPLLPPPARESRAPTLAHLRKLALCADTPDAAPELRAHMLANVASYAPLFGVATARLASAASETPDDKLSRYVLGSIGAAASKAREAKHELTAFTRDAAAARVSATLEPNADGTFALDRAALLEATEGASEGKAPFVRFAPREGLALDVAARTLRAILGMKRDARVTLTGGGLPTIVVRWGTAGRMRLVHQFGNANETPLTTIHLAGVARLDGGPADVVQGCQDRPHYLAIPTHPSERGAALAHNAALSAAARTRDAYDYERSERARANDDQTFRVSAPPPDSPPMPAAVAIAAPPPVPARPATGPGPAKAAPIPPRDPPPAAAKRRGKARDAAPPPPWRQPSPNYACDARGVALERGES